jgi:hypothetical protein
MFPAQIGGGFEVGEWGRGLGGWGMNTTAPVRCDLGLIRGGVEGNSYTPTRSVYTQRRTPRMGRAQFAFSGILPLSFHVIFVLLFLFSVGFSVFFLFQIQRKL